MHNQIILGNNLEILQTFQSEFVDLIYLDPPFCTQRNFKEFDDRWEWNDECQQNFLLIAEKYPAIVDFINSIEATHSKAMKAYITYITQRMIELYRILKETGSIYLHCDPTASHYLKQMMDCIFGRKNYKNEIIWHYQAGTKSKKFFGRKHDVILVYGKSDNAIHNRIGKPVVNADRYKYTSDDGRLYDVNGQGRRYYLDEGQTCDDVWTYTQEKQFQQLNSQSKERTGYPTQKPLALLHRIIKASSKEGDLVLDPFCGCATTCVASEQLKRKWIGIDIEAKAVEVSNQRIKQLNVNL